MASFPEVTQVVSQTGRPDDGTDTTGFFNTEYFVDLKRKEEWRPVFHQNKEALIAAMDKRTGEVSRRHLELLAAHLRQHGRGRLRRQGRTRRQALRRRPAHAGAEGRRDSGADGDGARASRTWASSASSASPTSISPSIATAAARWGINVADIQDAIQTAVGANALTQVQQGEARFDVTLRYQKQYRDTREAIENVRLLAPSGERVSLAQLTKVSTDDGAEQIYREGGQRYIAIKYSVRGRDLGSTVEEAIAQSRAQREAARRLSPRVGRRIREPEARRQAHGHRRSHHRAGHLPHPLHHVPLLQVGDAHPGQRHHGLHRRPAGAVPHPHQLLGLLGGRLPGALRRLGADRRHHDRVHQPAARAPQGHGRVSQSTLSKPPSRARSCACAPS